MTKFLLFVFLLVASAGIAGANNPEKVKSNASFTVENNAIALRFLYKKEGLVLSRIENKMQDAEVPLVNGSLLGLGEFTGPIENVSCSDKVKGTSEVLIEYPELTVKMQIRLYETLPLFACDYFVKLKKENGKNFSPEESRLLKMQFAGAHWKAKSVEFFDQTDHNNTLVKEAEHFPLKPGMTAKGNLLHFFSPLAGQGMFLLKEAPTTIAQLHYPGFDFKLNKNGVEVAGAGIIFNDLQPETWIKTYSVVAGFSASNEQDWLTLLRKYQKQSRSYSPEVDDMLMMNTWGDRNRDARVSEAFILEELKHAANLGITHYQIDDGWQQALSMNSAQKEGNTWDLWSREDWLPHPKRFPNGLEPVVAEAKKQGIKLGLWFHPSNHNDYENWEQDADIVLAIFQKHGIRYFKIDGIKLGSKKGERNLKAFLDKIKKDSKGEIYVNLDATADKRVGYNYFYEYGNIFLENRYTDWGSYYPHHTLRNLWMLSRYIPAEKLQIEFLNKWRNAKKYGDDNSLAPHNVPFSYQFAVTMAAQPLAWFEASGLPKESVEELKPLIAQYKEVWNDFHSGIILPVGDEPSGASWTGFQSVNEDRKEGFLLVFRENTAKSSGSLRSFLPANSKVELTHMLGSGDSIEEIEADAQGDFVLELEKPFSFALYRYRVR